MKNVKLVFPGLGYNNINQATVKIYDKCGNCIYRKKTYNSQLNVCLCNKQIYKIVAKTCNNKVSNKIYVNGNNTYRIPFNNSIYRASRTITFLLTDYNYNNLNIEKGKLILNG